MPNYIDQPGFNTALGYIETLLQSQGKHSELSRFQNPPHLKGLWRGDRLMKYWSGILQQIFPDRTIFIGTIRDIVNIPFQSTSDDWSPALQDLPACVVLPLLLAGIRDKKIKENAADSAQFLSSAANLFGSIHGVLAPINKKQIIEFLEDLNFQGFALLEIINQITNRLGMHSLKFTDAGPKNILADIEREGGVSTSSISQIKSRFLVEGSKANLTYDFKAACFQISGISLPGTQHHCGGKSWFLTFLKEIEKIPEFKALIPYIKRQLGWDKGEEDKTVPRSIALCLAAEPFNLANAAGIQNREPEITGEKLVDDPDQRTRVLASDHFGFTDIGLGLFHLRASGEDANGDLTLTPLSHMTRRLGMSLYEAYRALNSKQTIDVPVLVATLIASVKTGRALHTGPGSKYHFGGVFSFSPLGSSAIAPDRSITLDGLMISKADQPVDPPQEIFAKFYDYELSLLPSPKSACATALPEDLTTPSRWLVFEEIDSTNSSPVGSLGPETPAMNSKSLSTQRRSPEPDTPSRTFDTVSSLRTGGPTSVGEPLSSCADFTSKTSIPLQAPVLHPTIATIKDFEIAQGKFARNAHRSGIANWGDMCAFLYGFLGYAASNFEDFIYSFELNTNAAKAVRAYLAAGIYTADELVKLLEHLTAADRQNAKISSRINPADSGPRSEDKIKLSSLDFLMLWALRMLERGTEWQKALEYSFKILHDLQGLVGPVSKDNIREICKCFRRASIQVPEYFSEFMAQELREQGMLITWRAPFASLTTSRNLPDYNVPDLQPSVDFSASTTTIECKG